MPDTPSALKRPRKETNHLTSVSFIDRTFNERAGLLNGGDVVLLPRRCSRPLPSSQSLLAAAASETKEVCLLLKEYYKERGEEPPESFESEQEGLKTSGEPSQETKGLDTLSIDDPKLSRLGILQHKRFLHLSRSDTPVNSWREATRKEYNKLVRLVKEEQALYRQALLKFWQGNQAVLSVGFDGSDAAKYVEVALSSDVVVDELEGTSLPLRYGRHSQIISLRYTEQFSDLSIDRIYGQVLSRHGKGAQVEIESLLVPGTLIQPAPLPKTNGRVMQPPLVADDEALCLSQEHQADIITTRETLIELLKTNNDSQWLFPVFSEQDGAGNNRIFLDRLLPQPFSSPRDGLEKGMEDSIYHVLSSDSSVEYRYVLLQIPTRSRMLRVLVRVAVRLLDGMERPVTVHGHVEYFPERGKEQFTTIDKAVWAMDHILGGSESTSRVFVCRVDPVTKKCIDLQEQSLAHAVTEDSQWFKRFETSSPIDSFKRMATVLNASRTIVAGRHVLCFPGRGTDVSSMSASVHSADESGFIDILEEYKHAKEVSVGTEAFGRCLRSWEFQEDRIPYTFPPQGK